jgi:hypothetical protein
VIFFEIVEASIVEWKPENMGFFVLTKQQLLSYLFCFIIISGSESNSRNAMEGGKHSEEVNCTSLVWLTKL